MERIRAGTYQPTEKQIATFEDAIHKIHPNAEPRYSPNWERTEIWCPKCHSLWRTPPGSPLKASAFREHYKTCTGKPKGTHGRTKALSTNKAVSTKESPGAHTLSFFAAQHGWKRQKTSHEKSLVKDHELESATATATTTTSLSPSSEYERESTTTSAPITHPSEDDPVLPHHSPCTGITKIVDSRIETYLLRPTDGSGGARSKPKLALELYKKTYSALNSSQRKEVDLVHQHDKSWRADYELQAVFSTKCLHTAQIHDIALHAGQLSEAQRARLRLCSECRDLLNSSRFLAAIKIPLARSENQKYANKPYRHEKVAKIFARCRGLEEILCGINTEVSFTRFY